MNKILTITIFFSLFFGGSTFYYLYRQRKTTKKEEKVLPLNKDNKEIEKNIVTPSDEKENKKPLKKEIKEEKEEEEELPWWFSWKAAFFLFGPLLVIAYCILVIIYKKQKIRETYSKKNKETMEIIGSYNNKDMKDVDSQNFKYDLKKILINSEYLLNISKKKIDEDNFSIINNAHIFFAIDILFLFFLAIWKNKKKKYWEHLQSVLINALAFPICFFAFDLCYDKNRCFKEKVDLFERYVVKPFPDVNSSDLQNLETSIEEIKKAFKNVHPDVNLKIF